jgi:hypothetical protein
MKAAIHKAKAAAKAARKGGEDISEPVVSADFQHTGKTERAKWVPTTVLCILNGLTTNRQKPAFGFQRWRPEVAFCPLNRTW